MGGGRIVLVASLALALCGCNRVISSEPWFIREDAAGAPKFRDGLWVRPEGDCRFNEKRTVERWPDCARVTLVRGGQWLGLQWEEKGEGRKALRISSTWVDLPFVLANGDPLILQVETIEEAPPDSEEATDDGAGEDDGTPIKHYYYAAIRPTAHDDAGNVTRFEAWEVVCGPIPEPVADEGTPDAPAVTPNVTNKPFPGLTVQDNNCIAESKDAVRGAAVLSEALNEGPLEVAHWVREGWR